jgi:serine/threonine-protein kinase
MAELERVGKYEISEKIGAGGFGVVYKAWDPYIKRWVALKMCAATDEETRGRFFREAQLAGALQHPNITLVFDFGIEGETPYFVQEFLSGTDLDELAERRRLSLEGTLAVLLQVCTGLDFAHSRGIVHRDIKPANVRVLEDGTIKIMDFGIAKSLDAESRLTQTGVALGTAGYLAPEQLSGKPLDSRTDIFSLGVMAYELVTGRKPFAGPNVSNVIYQIVHQDPAPPHLLNPRCPQRLERALLKALAKNPEDRFATAREFGAELQGVLASLAGRTDTQRSETTTAVVRGELARAADRSTVELTPPTQLAARPLDQLPTASVHARRPALKRRLVIGLAAVGGVTLAVIGVLLLRSNATPPAAGDALLSPAAVPGTPAATTSPVPTPAPVMVAVELAIDPPSELEVDGTPLGRQQFYTVNLAVGPHTIVQRVPGYMHREHRVEVSLETRRLALALPPFGLLSVAPDIGIAIEGAVVTVGNRQLGSLPIRDRMVEAGSWPLVVRWPDGTEYREQIEVPAARTVRKVVYPQ